MSTSDDFVSGGSFKSGDLLITIDNLTYLNVLIQVKASLAQARELLALEQGRSRQARNQWQDLGDSNANDLFLRKPQLASAKAGLKSAESSVKIAQMNLERTRVKAPFNGRIAKVHAELGQFVNANTYLAEIYSLDTMLISAPLTSQQISVLGIDSLEANKGIEVQVTTTIGDKVGNWDGELINLDGQIDVNNRLYNAIIEVKNHHNPHLLSGMFVNVQMQSARTKKQLKVPLKALVEGDKIFVVEDNHLALKQVQILSKTTEYAYISGVESGEKVVVERPLWTQEGSEVIVTIISSTIKNV